MVDITGEGARIEGKKGGGGGADAGRLLQVRLGRAWS